MDWPPKALPLNRRSRNIKIWGLKRIRRGDDRCGARKNTWRHNFKGREGADSVGVRRGDLQRVHFRPAGNNETQFRQLCSDDLRDLSAWQDSPVEHPKARVRTCRLVLDLIIKDWIAAGVAGGKQIRRCKDFAWRGVHHRESGRHDRCTHSTCLRHRQVARATRNRHRSIRSSTSTDAHSPHWYPSRRNDRTGSLTHSASNPNGVRRSAFARDGRRNSKAYGPPARTARFGMITVKLVRRNLRSPEGQKAAAGPPCEGRIRISRRAEFNSIFTVYGRVVAGRTGANLAADYRLAAVSPAAVNSNPAGCPSLRQKDRMRGCRARTALLRSFIVRSRSPCSISTAS